MPFQLTSQRLLNQKLTSPDHSVPDRLVSWMAAIQAQDYYGGLWSIGMRLNKSSELKIEDAIKNKKIVRTWPMRGTLHFVGANDARWMLKLLTPKIILGSTRRLERMGLDEMVFRKSRKLITRALEANKILTREQLYVILEAGKVPAKNQLGIHILWRLAQEGLICFGPREGKKYTFVLLDEWLPAGKEFKREEALAEIAKRYFLSRGPATLNDFAWWTGLNLTEASRAIESVHKKLIKTEHNESIYWHHRDQSEAVNTLSPPIHLLQGFDEYMVAYSDRSMILDPARLKTNFHALVTPKILVNGKIAGTWKREIKGNTVKVVKDLFHPQPGKIMKKIDAALERYSEFIAKKIFRA